MRFVSIFLMLLWTVVWFFPVLFAYALKKKKLRGKMVHLYARVMLTLMGVQVKPIGELSQARPLLVVSNHISYLDILILFSLIDCRFVPKKEISTWPVINHFCKITDVVYVDRSKNKIHEGNSAIRQVLESGEVVVLFPEATTGDGKRLLPFKPAFFEAASEAHVQPVAIAYRKIRGLPIDYGQWPLLAWYGDMTLLPHMWKLLSLGKIEVEVHFLPVLGPGQGRKNLAEQAHDEIGAALLGIPQDELLA